MRKYSDYSEKSKQSQIEYSKKWFNSVNRVVIAFKPSDQSYFDKWQALPGDTNIDKIKGLLDRL